VALDLRLLALALALHLTQRLQSVLELRDRLLTFDERHFRTIRPLQGGSFTLLPADA
jgi:hypothetical protein